MTHGSVAPAGARGAPVRTERPIHGHNQRDVDLTDGDIALLACIADGATLHDMARHLHISHRTASRRLSEICEVLHVSRPIQAVAWAARRGLI